MHITRQIIFYFGLFSKFGIWNCA